MQNPDYDSYGVGDSLEPLFFDTAISVNQTDIAYKFIDSRLKNLKKEDGWSRTYQQKKYLERKIHLLQSEGRTND
ncbi:MAG: hypothetical protein JEZ03_15465 [Bacteroidales bacterium]|nr:hypothetical protein [Bacteroidales bacterium]